MKMFISQRAAGDAMFRVKISVEADVWKVPVFMMLVGVVMVVVMVVVMMMMMVVMMMM